MHKKILFIILILITIVTFTSCVKEKNVVFNENIAELDYNATNANFGSVGYPLAIRQPTPGRAIVSSADPFITRTSTTATFRVNMTGAQRGTPTNVKYNTFLVGTAVGPAITYGAPVSGVLTTIDAIAGTHYTALSGICTIPANSSFGTVTIPIINGGVTSSTTALLGIELIDGGDISVSNNYKKIAVAIAQK